MRLPIRPLDAEEFERKLESGDRRQGILLYNPRCPSCAACEPIRIDVDQFVPSRSQRRAFNRGERVFTVEFSATELTDEKVRLYNRHKAERDLMGTSDLIDAAGYNAFLVDSCVDSFEMQYRCEDRLVAVAIVDRAADSLSAVYTYFDPDFSHLSPGTYSIMKQVEQARRESRRYLYLGLYVEDCDAMRYKAAFFPHQRRVGGRWVDVPRPTPPARGEAR